MTTEPLEDTVMVGAVASPPAETKTGAEPGTGAKTEGARTGRRRRWPLLVIGASAGSATWSGWVGLGTLTGFGVVHPLPGIWDGLTLNTAITLPIGVEAYAVYALSVATDAAPLTRRARRYAWGSATAALFLGMAGQVAYHLVDASGSTRAPWWVVALVSCLPVGVLGAASLLWHLAGQPTDPAPAPLPVLGPDPLPAPTDAPENHPRERTVASDPSASPDPGAARRPEAPASTGTPSRPGAPLPKKVPQAGTASTDEELIVAVLAAETLPSARQIKAAYRIGQARAARIRAAALARRPGSPTPPQTPVPGVDQAPSPGVEVAAELDPQENTDDLDQPRTETHESNPRTVLQPSIPRIVINAENPPHHLSTATKPQAPPTTDTHATALP